MSQSLYLLLIEDSESDAALVVRRLERAGYDVCIERVQSAWEMQEALDRQVWDVIIADYHLPQFDAPAALAVLRDTGLDLPFIVVSGAMGEELAVAMMRSGAHDYLMKDNLTRLAPAVSREIQEARNRQQHRRADGALRDTLVELEGALAEKTVLLQEVHHRVKNNLAVICSLLSMKAGVTEAPEAKVALEDSQRRVQSIAMIHEHLYGNEHLDRVDFAEYAQQLVREISAASGAETRRIAVRMAAEPIELGVDQAVPCALILNELLTNAFKHAFPGGQFGEVEISFRECAPGVLELGIADNGAGCPAGTRERRGKSLGLNIVNILARQLDGELKQCPGPGTRFVLRFPAGASHRSASSQHGAAGQNG